jgi:hypothetical protein
LLLLEVCQGTIYGFVVVRLVAKKARFLQDGVHVIIIGKHLGTVCRQFRQRRAQLVPGKLAHQPGIKSSTDSSGDYAHAWSASVTTKQRVLPSRSTRSSD